MDETEAQMVPAPLGPVERVVGRAVPKRDNVDAQKIAARESAGSGGFDSRSLAEIVVKDRVRFPDEAQAFSEFCTVAMQRPDSRERPAPYLLTRRLLVVCFGAPNAELTGAVRRPVE